MSHIELNLAVESKAGKQEMKFPIQRLVCAGWVGRNKKALQSHIDELFELGVPKPTRMPIFMNLSPYLATSSKVIDVINGQCSGEVEYVILIRGSIRYIGVGSDHTDREFEKFSIPASKQMCAKVIAPVVWPYMEVNDHWDQIVIRSWVVNDGKRTLYQEDTLAAIMNVEALLDQLPKDSNPSTDIVLFSGTPATKGGIVYGKGFDFEMVDPVLSRKISHGYSVQVLAQYL
jgi:hypothetical protein